MKRNALLALALSGALLVPATAAAQEDMGTGVDCSAFEAGALVHFMGPYTQQLLDGAQAAADECGANIVTAGPPAFDSQQQVTLFNDIVAGGADAVVLVAFPAEFWIRPIDEAVADGVVVSSFDVESPASLQSLHTAPKQKDQGRAMANVLADALIAQHGEDPSGTVYVGICLPGLELIEARIVGFRETMTERLPNVEIPPNFDVAFDQTENFARWNDVIDQNPGGIAYVGYCENDLPSLVRIKEADPEADYLISSIGINPDGLQGIADGTALAAIGQKPFMQGYVAMRAMLENLANGTDTPRGWIDVQPEVVTAENVEEVIAREESLSEGTAATQAYYQPEIDALFADINSQVQSFADLLGD
jgi:ABC-type sugar transport system substrate-binding protein